jgi:peptide/nickel transport system substrate-binding protein
MNSICYLVFDPILILDEEGNLKPWIAESYEFAKDDTWVKFKLREDVYFTNGVQLTADDLIFTFERLRDDRQHLPDSVAKNWRNYIGALEKVDKFTVILNFSQTMPEFWYQIVDPTFQLICKSAYEQMGYDAFWQHPVGTGPYVVESWDAANSVCKMTIRTDEHGYWGYKATNTYTNVKNITIQYSPEGQTRLASLRSGEVHIIDNVPTTDTAILERQGFRTEVMRPKNVVFLQTTSSKGDIFDNEKLREALSLCIDRELIIETLLSGFGIPTTEPCRPGDLGYTGKQNIFYDPVKAKQLVAESGYNGRPINFIFTQSTVAIGNELTQAIQSMAKDVGINLQIKMLETAIYDQARSNHDYDLCLAAIADSGNMWLKIGSDVIGSDRFNTGFQNVQLKELGKSIGVTMDPVKADQLYKEVYAIETREFAPNIYLYWPTLVTAWSPRLSGVFFHFDQKPDLHAVVLN